MRVRWAWLTEGRCVAGVIAFVVLGGVIPLTTACSSTATGTGGADASSGPTGDSGTSGGPAVACTPLQPALFQSVPNTGPYCQAATPKSRCAIGERCCNDLQLGTHVCAASCPSGVAEVACYNMADCPAGQICCANGAPTPGVCTYQVVANFKGTRCSASCGTGEYQACAGNAECGGKVCTPTFVLNPSGTATTTVQSAACL